MPALVNFCYCRVQVDNPLIPFEAFPPDAEYFAVCPDAGQAAKHKPRKPFGSHGAYKRLKLFRAECFDRLALCLVLFHQTSFGFAIPWERAKPVLGVPEQSDYFGAKINAPPGGCFF